MKKLSFVFAFVLACLTVAHAQMLSTKWQPTIHAKTQQKLLKKQFLSQQATHAAPTLKKLKGVHATMAEKLRLDSIVSASNVSFRHKEEFVYNNNQQSVQHILYEETGSNSWYPVSKEEVEYDIAGKTSKVELYLWNGSAWLPDFRVLYGYNADTLKEEVTQSWNDSVAAWQNTTKRNYSYNNNLITAINISEWYDTLWIPFLKQEFVYDNNIIVADTTFILFEFPFIGMIEVPVIHAVYNYATGTNLLTSLINYELSDTAWVLSSKIEHTYFSDGSLNTTTTFEWDSIAWKPINLFKFYIDSTVTNLIFPNSSTGSDDVIYLSIFTTAEDTWKSKVITSSSFEWDNTAWVLTDTVNWYYSTVLTSLRKELGNGVKSANIYPNPAQTEFVIERNQATAALLQIYDNTGKVVKTAQLNELKQQISIAELPKGMYYVRILQPNETVETHKLIVE